jgi:GT2 family glycosyltransferase
MAPDPLVYIILVSWNHWDVTSRCLAQLSELDYANYQIVVVDNGSVDGTPQKVEDLYPRIQVLCNERNLGFAAGCNVGLRHALEQGADYVWILNNDTIPPRDILSRLVAHAESLPSAGIMTPAAGWVSGVECEWPTAGVCHRWTQDFVKVHLDRAPARPPLAVDYVFGTAMFLRREVLENVGFFDERYFMYYEDMDLCLRARRAGFQLFAFPDVRVFHEGEASTEGQPALRYYYKARSSVLFFRAHTSGLRVPVVLAYRLGSAVHWTARFAGRKQFGQLRFYWRGLLDGLRFGSVGYAARTL